MTPQNAETAILSASYMDYVSNKGIFFKKIISFLNTTEKAQAINLA